MELLPRRQVCNLKLFVDGQSKIHNVSAVNVEVLNCRGPIIFQKRLLPNLFHKAFQMCYVLLEHGLTEAWIIRIFY